MQLTEPQAGSDVGALRTRDHLLVTGVAPVSEFLDDFRKPDRVSAAHR